MSAVNWKVVLPLTALIVLAAVPLVAGGATNYTVVDTGQVACYDDASEIVCPSSGPFYGQDAQYTGVQPSYIDNGDGTITDQSTSLMWQQTPDLVNKSTYADAVTGAATFNLAGHSDWRLPTIKELYSIIDFSGIDPSGWTGTDTSGLTPFIDTNYFDFAYGDTSAGERVIDAQYWSSTEYVSTMMNGDATVFGVNFADGRIKGYPSEPIGPPGSEFTMTSFVRYVRGGTSYGVNDFVDNGDGTVTDLATGLMWTQDDSGVAYDWEGALNYAETLTQAGHNDWRLPNAKELQSIVDYTRSPATTASAAIDPILNATSITDEGGGTDYPFYWTGTTHANWTATPGGWAVYVAFGEALGWMQPPGGGAYVLLDVHGAGSQRSDPKTGDPADWPNGNGPQGDVVRIFNYVRAVRDAGSAPTPTPTLTPTPAPTPTPTPSPTPGDDDGDGVENADEVACGSDPFDAAYRPERVDGSFAGVSDDGDADVDEALPAGSEGYDCDGDGYVGTAESYVFSSSGGQDEDACGTDGWPSDLNASSGPPDSFNQINILDITSFLAPVRYFGSDVGSNLGDVRWDLIPGKGVFLTEININDLIALIAGSTGNPPMLGGVKAFGGAACPWAP